jgi:hypothetical protein
MEDTNQVYSCGMIVYSHPDRHDLEVVVQFHPGLFLCNKMIIPFEIRWRTYVNTIDNNPLENMKDRKLSNIGVKYHSKFMTIDRIFTSKFNSVLAQSGGIA